jgi:hypothetical protein
MTFNTGNPIGSTDARDRSDNSENLDLAVNSLALTFKDRLGVTRDTLEGVYQKSAYYRAGTFDAGYTLTNNRQTLAYGNVEYSWSGSFGENGKQVPPSSTPATTGGVGAGAWVDRTDLTLRSDINIVQKLFNSVSDMIADTTLTTGQVVEWVSYYSNLSKGGNRAIIVPGGSGITDGGTFIQLSNGLQAKALFSDGQYTPERFGAYGDYDPVSLIGHNDYLSILACFATGKCILSANTKYKYAGTGTVPRLTTSLCLEGASPAAIVASQTSSIIYVTTPEVPFFIGGVASVEFKNMAFICNKHAPATDNTSLTADNMQTCQFKMTGVHLRGNSDSTITSDTHANTDQLLTSSSAYVSAKTITDFSPYNTYNEVGAMHGRGLVLTKCLDAKIEGMISGFGVGLVNWGSDLTNIEKCRISSNGINIYDKYLGSGAGGSYGTQLKIKNSEILYNFRAPCILLDGSRVVDIDDIYYEVLKQSGVFIAAKSSNFVLRKSRIDDVWHRTSGTDQPFMLIDGYTEGNIIEDNAYFHFSVAVPKEVPEIRFINTATGTMHKRNGFSIRKQRTCIFPPPSFSDATNSTYITTFDNDNLNPYMLTPTNIWGGAGVEHEPTVQNGVLCFYNPASTGKYFTGRMKIRQLTDTLTIKMRAQTLSGDKIWIRVTLKDNEGRDLATIKMGAFFGGFNNTSYVTGTLTQAGMSDYPTAAYVECTWLSSEAFVSSWWIE